MDQTVILDLESQQRLLRVMESAAQVRCRQQLFLWAQGHLFALVPHDILMCLRLPRDVRGARVESIHGLVMERDQEIRLCDPQQGLAVRLARHCEAVGRLPCLVTTDVNGHQGPLREDLREELRRAGLRNAVVHGDRVDANDDASFFILFNIAESPGPAHGQLMRLLLPHLYVALNRVLSSEAEPDNESADTHSLPPMTDRQQQILQWICSGKSNYEIGVILNISPLTVKNHVQTIFRKFNVHNRAQAVSLAMSLNLFRRGD